MTRPTKLGLVLRGKDAKKLEVYLSQVDKYNIKTLKCIDAAVSECIRLS